MKFGDDPAIVAAKIELIAAAAEFLARRMRDLASDVKGGLVADDVKNVVDGIFKEFDEALGDV